MPTGMPATGFEPTPPAAAYDDGFGTEAREFVRQLRTPETKEFFKTSEFMLYAIVSIGLIIGAAVQDTFDAAQAWTMLTVLTALYMLSRGIAKSGSRRGDPQPY